jgi:hypothetical protein
MTIRRVEAPLHDDDEGVQEVAAALAEIEAGALRAACISACAAPTARWPRSKFTVGAGCAWSGAPKA